MPLTSVIVCTHNPRPDYLSRVLVALRAQTLPVSDWELLLMDNASSEPLDRRFDIAWHPAAQMIRVKELGKVAALLQAVQKAKGELLVIVDDDNVLNSDYLATACRLGRDWPILGAWGGSIVAEFEECPKPWAKPYLAYLAIRKVTRDQWSNLAEPANAGQLPWGAGLCLRREVAAQWAARTTPHSFLRQLDRKGKGLLAGEDIEMALAAGDLCMGTGLFAALRLTHLIRAERVSETHLLKVVEGMVYSLHLGAAVRGQPPEPTSWPRFLWGHLTALRRGPRELRFHRAAQSGRRAALKEIARWQNSDPEAARKPASSVSVPG